MQRVESTKRLGVGTAATFAVVVGVILGGGAVGWSFSGPLESCQKVLTVQEHNLGVTERLLEETNTVLLNTVEAILDGDLQKMREFQDDYTQALGLGDSLVRVPEEQVERCFR